MRDPYIHAEKTSLPGFGHKAIRALITDALGVAPDLPKTVWHRLRPAPPVRVDSTVPERDHLPGLPGVAAGRVPVLGRCRRPRARAGDGGGPARFPDRRDLRGEERTYRALAARSEVTR